MLAIANVNSCFAHSFLCVREVNRKETLLGKEQ